MPAAHTPSTMARSESLCRAKRGISGPTAANMFDRTRPQLKLTTFVADAPEIPRCARDKLKGIQTGSTVADRQLAFWLFLLTFVTYAYFHGGGGWNQNSQFDLTRAVVERHTFAIDAYASNTGDVSAYHGHVYTNKAPGLSLLAVIPYMFLHAFERDPDDPLV